MEGVTITSLVTSIGEFFSGAIAWVGDVGEAIVSDPFMTLMCICVPIAGIAIGYTRRLIKL